MLKKIAFHKSEGKVEMSKSSSTNKSKAINVGQNIKILFNIKKVETMQLLDCSPQYNTKHQMQQEYKIPYAKTNCNH